MSVRRLLIFLLLNAAVSAAATLTVLWVWDRTHPAGARALAGDLPGTQTLAPGATATSGAPVLLPTALAAPAEPTSAEPAPTPTIYSVKAGDTLGTIAQQFNVSVDDLVAANGLNNADYLMVGQRLVIPLAGYVPPTEIPPTAGALPAQPTPAPRATATAWPNAAPPRLVIREVIGSGRLEQERLVIANEGGPVDLAGWSLRSAVGHTFIFPALVLLESASVNLHTAAGTDTAEDLYWGQAQAVWAAGQTVLLSDAAGNLHARYTVP